MSDYSRALDWLYGFASDERPSRETRLGRPDRMRSLLALLGNPHLRWQAVHIAGTKGKGSTAAFAESILRAAGYKTGLYTSPHLHTFRERIRIEGELVSREQVVAGVERLRALQPAVPGLSTFDLITALGFQMFAEQGVEVAVIEVGLGGRLDATNVIQPLASVITSISYDHTEVLGETLEQIAHEKAGIIKWKTPIISEPQEPAALEILTQAAQAQESPLTLLGRDWSWEIQSQDLEGQEFRAGPVARGQTPRDPGQTYRTSLLGSHQVRNSVAALAMCHTLAGRALSFPQGSFQAGLERARWPGRFEVLSRRPYRIVDGAHNRDSAHQLVETVRALLPAVRVQWIFGSSREKDIRGMLTELAAHSTDLIVTRAAHPRAASPAELSTLAREIGLNVTLADTVGQSLDMADRTDCGVIIITGSLFVVAEARAEILRRGGEPVENDL